LAEGEGGQAQGPPNTPWWGLNYSCIL